MTDLKIRSYTDKATGKRVSLRFEAQTWSAIDDVAKSRGETWQTWVGATPTQSENRHTDVRVALVKALRGLRAVQFQAGETHPLLNAPAMRDAFTVTDAGLRDDLAGKFTFVDSGSTMDFGGFLIRAGWREGVMCIWVQNGLRDGVHLVIPYSAPITLPDGTLRTDGVAA